MITIDSTQPIPRKSITLKDLKRVADIMDKANKPWSRLEIKGNQRAVEYLIDNILLLEVETPLGFVPISGFPVIVDELVPHGYFKIGTLLYSIDIPEKD